MGIAEPIYLATKRLLDKITLLVYTNNGDWNGLVYKCKGETERDLFLDLWSTHKVIKIRDDDDPRHDFASIRHKLNDGSYLFDVNKEKFLQMYKNCETFLSGEKLIKPTNINNNSSHNGWELIENNKTAQIKSNGIILFEFPTTWSNKYLYFKYLWNNKDIHVSYKTLYESNLNNPKYPAKGRQWKVNKGVREEINKLRNNINFPKKSINIITQKGFCLIIN